MKVLFYSPYIPNHFGGGEKHFFDVASVVATKHEVSVAIPHEYLSRENNSNIIKKKYETFLNYSLQNIQFIASDLKNGSVLDKLKETRQFDYVYFVTDGSFFISGAKKNNLHIQIPFTNKLNIWEQIKLATWQIKNTNSEFTKSVVEKSWHTKVTFVHNPLVSLEEIKSQDEKEKIIIHVGRFFKQLHSKRQDVLVAFFKKLVDQNKKELAGWKLLLVGSVEDEQFLAEIKSLITGYPIEILTNVSREMLVKLYRKASIYWHATGFGVDETVNPEKVEHFGITTIEAMAAGCVPVVINKGGQKEILGSELKTLLWNSETECLETTKNIILNASEYEKYQRISLQRVKKFSKPVFEATIWKMF